MLKYIQVQMVIIVDYSSAYVHLEYSRNGWIVYCEPTVGISYFGKDWTGLDCRVGGQRTLMKMLIHILALFAM